MRSRFRFRPLGLATTGGALICLIACAGLAAPAQAAFPGKDGKIAFVWDGPPATPSCGDIYTINSNGSGLRRVTPGCPNHYDDPAFSADGHRIAFEENYGGPYLNVAGIYTMDATGSRVRRVTHGVGDAEPAFSPNRQWIVWDGCRWGGHQELCTAKFDGSEAHHLTYDPNFHFDPTFSPNGGEIAFTKQTEPNGAPWRDNLYTMHPNGSHVRQLTHAPAQTVLNDPDFSPNGRRILMLCGDPSQVCVTRADGTHLEHLTHTDKSGFSVIDAVFSPSGRYIALVAAPQSNTNSEWFLYTMRANGSGLRKVFDLGDFNLSSGVSWQPVH